MQTPMTAMNVYSTVDRGRTHIAFDEQYQGSVNSYNNFFTKFFANLFSLSIDVTVGSKIRRLNKKSYIDFLSSHAIPGVTCKSVSSYSRLDAASIPCSPGLGFMRQHLSVSKIDSLSCKLIRSIRAQDQNKAINFLGKGANPNYLFWVRGNDGQTVLHGSLEEGLPHQTIPVFASTLYSPLLYTKASNQHEIARRLEQFGADRIQRGQVRSFQRTVINAGIKTNLYPTVDFRVRKGHHYPRVVSRTGVDAEVKQDVRLEDFSKKIAETFLGVSGEYFSTPVTEPATVRLWMESTPILRYKLF